MEEYKSNEVLNTKAIAMAVLGIVSFLLGLLPMHLSKLKPLKIVNGDKNLVISLLLCFGGGVLLFTTFLHLQPEVRETFSVLESKGVLPDIGLPISELVFCLGFFFVYLVEEFVHLVLHKKMHNNALHRSLSIRCSTKTNENLAIPRVTLSKFDDGSISYISNSNKDLLNSQTKINIDKRHDDHSHIDGAIASSIGGFLAVLALSFHAVFEGLAVGLENNVQKVWYLFLAIATHKFVIGFCVGLELVTSKTKSYLIVLYIGTFAVVTPLGIGIGIILSEKDASQDDIYSVVLQGMAAGTLLYVVFFEVLARERGNRHSGLCQLIAILAGFGIMLTLQVFTGHEHSHHEEGHHNHYHEHFTHENPTTLQSN